MRLLFSYMWAHPGKKLLFMGGEFAQWNEWNESRELDWPLLEYPAHKGVSALVRDLNGLLCNEGAMYLHDHDWLGFDWLDCSDYGSSVYSFARTAEGCRPVMWVFNFTPVVREGYQIPCPHAGTWRECLNTDSHYYGGTNVGNPSVLRSHEKHWSARPALTLTLPPLAALALIPT